MEHADAVGGILGLLSLLSAAWAVCGLLKPKIVLWWAVPEKQTRGRAFMTGLISALFFLFFAMTWLPDSAWWLWIPTVLCLLFVLLMISAFRMTEKEYLEQVQAKERSKKAAITHTIYSSNSDKEYEIHPFLIICSCPDWRSRRHDADGPFAVCKHLAGHYVSFPEEMPEELAPYRHLILYFSCEDKGLPHQGEICEHGVIDDMAYLFTGYADSLPWVNVYTDAGGTERYGVNYETGRWANGKEPPHADVLLERVKLLAP